MNLSSQRLQLMSLLNRLLNQCQPDFSLFLRLAAIIVLASASPTFIQADDSEQFFESRIRPLLIEKCLECHNAEKQSGGLRLDSRDHILKGGDSGAAMIPGDPAASRLIQAIRYDGDLQMPPETPLADDQKKLLTHWIELGAPWPADSKPMLSEKTNLAKTHWAFQPVQHFDPPQVAKSTLSVHKPVDAFLLARLNAAGLEMSPETDRRTLTSNSSSPILILKLMRNSSINFWLHPHMVSNGLGIGWMLLVTLTPKATSTAAKNASGFMHGIIVTGS